jgi:hypothetical protein
MNAIELSKCSMSSESTVLCAIARLNNKAELDEMLASIPNGEPLRKMLLKKRAGRTGSYDAETRVARYIISTGKEVACFSFTNLTRQQTERIRVECDAVISTWSFDAFIAAAKRALGASFESVQ